MNSDVKKNCKRKRHTAEMMLPNVKWIMTKSNTYDIGFSTNEMTSVLLCYILVLASKVDREFHNLLPSGEILSTVGSSFKFFLLQISIFVE